jgi:hypothetical protein
MIRHSLYFLLAMTLSAVLSVRGVAAEPQLGHMVYFTLKQSTDEGREKLAAACHKYLSGHEGTVYFSVGVLAQDLKREVNDRDFDVALHMVFANRTAHNVYQTSPRHLKFIEEYQTLWNKVRVFDAYIVAAPTTQASR